MPLWDRYLAWTQANESSYVKDPRRARRMVARQGLLAVVAIAALVGEDWAPGWLGAVCGALLGWFVGMGLFRGVSRALAYKAGWLEGRMAMIGALAEAQHRGMSPDDWLRGEMARDYAVMGVPLPPWHEDGRDGI